jgi:Excreted virulence factor EspC, type VII ESX diderm
MTSPLQVDTEELVQLANGHEVLIEELSGGRAPQIKGDWPSMAAAQAALGAARASKATAAARLGANADALRGAAGAYQGQDRASGAKLGGIGEAIKFSDITQLIQLPVQAATQLTQACIGVVGSAVGEIATPTAGVIGAAINAATTGSHNTGPTSGALGPQGNGQAEEHSEAVHPGHLRGETAPPQSGHGGR